MQILSQVFFSEIRLEENIQKLIQETCLRVHKWLNCFLI